MLNLFEKEKFDIGMNFVAESHVDRWVTNLEIFAQINVIDTQVLLDASKVFNTGRYHQISTAEVYVDLQLDRIDLFFTEIMPINSSSTYSVSKLSLELLVYSYYKTCELKTTISICSNNYEPYYFLEKLTLFIISRHLNNENISVYEDGENVTNWLYVEGYCAAIDLIIHSG